MSTIRFLPPLPTAKIPAPWSTTFHLLDQPSPQIALVSPAMQTRLDMDEAEWRAVWYWVVKKKWPLTKIKLPLSRKQAQLHEPRGELMFRTLELCIRCHHSDYPEAQYYPSPAEWYRALCQEAKHIGRQRILANETGGKTPTVKERYEIIAALKHDLDNPANPETSPHCHRLYSVALKLENQDDFYTQYWKPFLRACSKWTEQTDSPSCQATHIENNRIVQQAGRGKGKLTIIGFS